MKFKDLNESSIESLIKKRLTDLMKALVRKINIIFTLIQLKEIKVMVFGKKKFKHNFWYTK